MLSYQSIRMGSMKHGGWASLTLIYLYGVVSAASLTKAIAAGLK